MTVDRAAQAFIISARRELPRLADACTGVSDPAARDALAALVLHRLAFLAFVPTFGSRLLSPDALRGPLTDPPSTTLFRAALVPLFRRLDARSPSAPGGAILRSPDVPRLGCPLFDLSPLEQSHPDLDLPDEALTRLLALLARYRWQSDAFRADPARELTPEVLDFFHTRRIDRRRSGTYFTHTDVAGFIARAVVLPALLQSAARTEPALLAPSRLGPLLARDPLRYIPSTLAHGFTVRTPGLRAQLTGPDAWQRPAPDGLGLPTEACREMLHRRREFLALRRRLLLRQVVSLEAALTANLDLLRLTLDLAIAASPAELAALWHALRGLRILDPTCGSGAFLLACWHVLEAVYQACLDRCPDLAAGAGLAGAPSISSAVRRLALDNLHGIDLHPDALDLARHRLYLHLLAAGPAGPLASLPLGLHSDNILSGPGTLAQPQPGERLFDVVLGNPPYIEQPALPADCPRDTYATNSCGNLHALIAERALALLRPGGWCGLVVPHAAFCTDRMVPLQQLLLPGGATWVSTFDIRPSQLFPAVDQRLAIVLHHRGGLPRTYSTRYHRWYEPARPHLFGRPTYTDVTDLSYPGSVPKLGTPREQALWRKLAAFPPLAKDLGGDVPFWYHNAPRYWVRALTFVPHFANDRDGPRRSLQLCELHAPTPIDARALAAVLNSNLFAWWWQVLSDNRHLNLREIARFPLSLHGMAPALKHALADLCDRLMADYRRHAARKECRYRTTGRVTYDEFYPRHSKPLLDDIDALLARHYGLSNRELDFLIHFDLRFRMGEESSDGPSPSRPLRKRQPPVR